MLRQGHACETRAVFDQNIHIFLLVDRDDLGRTMQIALGIGRPHFDLAFVIEIAFWNSHRADRFEDEVIFFLDVVGHEPVGDPARDDDVIFRAIRQLAENGLERAAALEDEDDFVRATVPVILELVVGLWPAAPDRRSCPG